MILSKKNYKKLLCFYRNAQQTAVDVKQS